MIAFFPNGTRFPFLVIIIVLLFASCSRNRGTGGDEQIRVYVQDPDSTINSIVGNASLDELSTYPQKVILTGLNDHRLVTIYKHEKRSEKNRTGSYRRYYNYYDEDYVEHFMPGIDLAYGYNLLNIAHYDLKREQLNLLFPHPVLVKSLYYPSFVQDSVGGKPVNRNYFLVSVYDEDTNADTLISTRDLRRFYHFDASCTERVQLIPPDYSVTRSQYDKPNDVMYIFARHDANKNGRIEEEEPLHVFWLNLRSPSVAKRLY